MSEDNVAGCCASCGVAEIDDVKLMPCDGCDLVKYCSDECQTNHRSEHEEACKKRAAEIRDESLFKQPESTHMGDCPICMIPLPLDKTKSNMYTCCGKVICNGCVIANLIREIERGRLQPPCLFCREAVAATEEEAEKRRRKRIEANDSAVMLQEGWKQRAKGEYIHAFDCFTKAAELGDAWAHYELSIMYDDGETVEKDEVKKKYHLEVAAIGGHPEARYMLGCVEGGKGNIERAMKHFIIAATQGYGVSMKELMNAFKEGHVSKEDLAATLRAHKAAVDETKSKQRDVAEKINAHDHFQN